MARAETLKQELLDFNAGKSRTGRDTFGAGRESERDDLLVATMLSTWYEHRRGIPKQIDLAPSPYIELTTRDWFPFDVWSR